MVRRLGKSFFARNTLEVARDLLGCYVIHEYQGLLLAGQIVETEAYMADDPACHAYRSWQALVQKGKQPKGRSALLFDEPGLLYVYLNYGMYWLLNVVTEKKGIPGAVLIRAIKPVAGIDFMKSQRPHIKRLTDLTNGPGKLTRALAIEGDLNGEHTRHSRVYFSRKVPGVSLNHSTTYQMIQTPRIGISQGTNLLWRFIYADHPFVSAEPRRQRQNPQVSSV